MPIDADWCWLMMIDTDWCLLMLIDVDYNWCMFILIDWSWLILVDADWWWQGWGSAGVALHERSGSSTKGRTPNIRYFVAKPCIVAIYALFERLSQGFEWKSSCFRRAFNESHPMFGETASVKFSAYLIFVFFLHSHILRLENFTLKSA